MTTQEQLAYLERQQRGMMRRLGVLTELQRGARNPSRLVQAEAEAIIVSVRAFRPVLEAARQAAFDEQRRTQRAAERV